MLATSALMDHFALLGGGKYHLDYSIINAIDMHLWGLRDMDHFLIWYTILPFTSMERSS